MLNFIACNLSPTDESKLIGIDPITLDLHRSGTLICHLVWYTGHWMQTSSYVTSGRLFLSYPEQRNTRQFQETHFSRSSHELVRKSAINTPLHAVFFFFFSSNQAFLPTTWLTSRKLGSRKMSSYQQKLLEESQSHSINLQRSRSIPLLPPRSQNFRFIYRLSCYAESFLRVEQTFSKKTFLPRLLCNF